MGVSGLLRDVLKRYPTIHLPAPHPDIRIDYLFLDFNAFIYNTISAFPKDIVYDFTKKTDITKYENRLVKLVIENTLDLVNKICKPTKLLYIAIDGPPPLAKMVQQRERRYKNPYMELLMKEYDPGKLIKGMTYDKNRITPGTRLMRLLNDSFRRVIMEGKFGGLMVVFDGSDIPGEAEHKYLKLIEEMDYEDGENFVIFSGDGDAILLSLRYPDRNMYIMQGVMNTALEDIYPPEQQFAFIDSSQLGNSIYDMFEDKLQSGGKKFLTDGERRLMNMLSGSKSKRGMRDVFKDLRKKRFLIDFIFLSFLEGNDFAKPIYFMKYKDDHMKTPLGIYKFHRKIHNYDSNFRLIYYNNGQMYINQKFFYAIIKRLGDIEEERIKEVKNRLEKKMSYMNVKKNNKDAMEHKLFTNKDHILHNEFVKQYNFLFSYSDFKEFKKHYYEYFWDNEYDIDTICKNYLNILLFNIRYYFGTGLYWDLNYDAVAAPLPSDLANFMSKNPKYLEEVNFKDGEPVHPFVLLAYVMPPQSMEQGILPKKYKDELLKRYPEYFPERIDMKLLVPGGKLIYAEPHFKSPPINILKEVLKDIKLTKDEVIRNELKLEPVVYIPK